MRLAPGAAAGLAGAAAMHAFRIAWERMVSDRPRDGIFGFDREADVRSAQWMGALVFGDSPAIETAARVGLILHYGYGAALGATYASARKWAPRISSGRGIAAGAVLWLAADEVPITLLGISKPLERSACSHISALAAHLLYVATLETMLRRW